MTGNVREWVSDFYVKLYYQRSPYYNPTVLNYGDKGEHLVRGGSWKETDYHSTIWFRFDEHDIYETHLIGFRCARTATEGTPTPTLTPTPTATPTPYAHTDIGSEGGAVWLTYPNHLTLLTFPENALDTQTAFTLTYNRLLGAQNLHANNHSFSIEAQQQVSSTEISQLYLEKPAQLIVGYHELSGIISSTIDLYRLTASGWTTEQITKVAQTPDYIIADIHWLGIYGLLGETNRTYLPLILRK